MNLKSLDPIFMAKLRNTARAMKSRKLKCHWVFEEHICAYETSCKEAFEFTDGFVKENKFKFCPFCGKEIDEHDR